MAELEAERDVSATYFLMTRSVFYNLDSHEGEAALERACASSAIASGCTPSTRTSTSTSASIPCSRGTTPTREYVNEPVDGLVNVMTPPWFDRDHYRSDSNQHFRSGDPTDALARGELEWLQL